MSTYRFIKLKLITQDDTATLMYLKEEYNTLASHINL